MNSSRSVGSLRSVSSVGTHSTIHRHHNAGPPLFARFKAAYTKWRVLQWGVWLALVIGVAIWANQAVRQTEEDAFESAFQQTADQILQYSNQAFASTMALSQTFSLAITANNEIVDAWPLVTIPSFDVQAQNYRNQTHVGVVGFVPLVNDATEWARHVSDQTQQFIGTTPITPYIFKVESGVRVQEFALIDGSMAPLWQVDPMMAEAANIDGDNTNYINYNLYATPWIQDLLLTATLKKEAHVSGVLNPADMEAIFPQIAALPAIMQEDAWSLLVQPIFRTTTALDEHQEIVGHLLSFFPWGATLFGQSLGWNNDNFQQQESVLCVLRGVDTTGNKNNGESYTYRVQGSQVEFLGPGDVALESSDVHGDDPVESQHSTMAGQRRRRQLQTTNSAESSNLPMAGFSIDVYSTNDFHDSYTTNAPGLYTFLVILILSGLALWFAICQHYQEKENRTKDRVRDAMGGVDWSRASVASAGSQPWLFGKKKDTPRANNKQLMNAFLSDQKQTATQDESDKAFLEDDFGDTVQDQNNNDIQSSQRSHRSRAIGQSQRSRSNIDQSQRSHHSHNPGQDSLLPRSIRDSKPIADLFPSASVSMSDISGFTAWASVREPSTAFTLLETIYHTFDKLAQRKGVFKVETIGDCYVSVCGLPERRKDHAVALCHYARGCLRRFTDLTHMLEETLGPETSELSLRIGINSGPIMAGILRGESQARFQLFGETVSLASTIESAGKGGRVHMSKDTAAQLTEAGKGHWLVHREDKIPTSKGELQTFWLANEATTRRLSTIQRQPSGLSDCSLMDESGWEELNEPEQARTPHFSGEEAKPKMMRLVGWNCEIMTPLLKMIVARRTAERKQRVLVENEEAVRTLEDWIGSTKNVLDEVEEVISLPHYDGKVQKKIKSDPAKIQLGCDTESQLREFVETIASLYLNNPFHNFEHASHVAMSTMKLLSRIVAPEDVISFDKKQKDVASALHDTTYGITSDPLTQFAVILAALIHDVDHRGIPNNILAEESPALSAVYKGQSIAEQNSVDIAWECLMDPRFANLRRCIYGENEAELKRFRVLLVNCVMSTDIFDKELSALRKARWQKAFSIPDEDAATEDINRKATIVIEHLIQASDVSHTMQHWHVYQKWNEKLFQEMYTAYRLGRCDKDPSAGWYKGEIWFYDNYVIPLAKKLKDCGVFGVSSDEYLTYAENNRNEWEEKGERIVKSMLEKYQLMMDVHAPKKPQSKAENARQP